MMVYGGLVCRVSVSETGADNFVYCRVGFQDLEGSLGYYLPFSTHCASSTRTNLQYCDLTLSRSVSELAGARIP